MTEEQARIIGETLKAANDYGRINLGSGLKFERRDNHYVACTVEEEEEGDLDEDGNDLDAVPSDADDDNDGPEHEISYFAEVQGRHLLLLTGSDGDVVIEADPGTIFTRIHA